LVSPPKIQNIFFTNFYALGHFIPEKHVWSKKKKFRLSRVAAAAVAVGKNRR
jgi:hypothetical protein